jgi:hypothetical protein
MSRRNTAVMALLFILLGPILASLGAQNTPKKEEGVDFLDIYYPLLDVLFPTPTDYSFLDCSVVASLRFIPNPDPESQINVCIRRSDGQDRAVEYSIPAGSTRIMARLSDLYRNHKLGSYDPIKLAKQFKVEVRTINIPGNALRDLFDQLQELHFPAEKRPEPGMVTTRGGTEHLFRYKSDQCEVRFEFYYAAGQDKVEFGRPFAEWMDRVQRTVASLK